MRTVGHCFVDISESQSIWEWLKVCGGICLISLALAWNLNCFGLMSVYTYMKLIAKLFTYEDEIFLHLREFL